MNRALSSSLLIAALVAPQAPAQGATPPVEVASVQDLVKLVKQRETAVKAVELEMRTKGILPGGSTVETSGTLRVLGTRHFHTTMHVDFGDGMESEFETLKTPEGVLMRERDPAQGEIFVRLDKELAEELESASKVLERQEGLGADSELAAGPLGSVMLEDVSAQFDLAIAGPRDVGGRSCWILSGPLRAGVADADGRSPADRVELVVRADDLAVVRMTQFARQKPVVEVEIVRLELDGPLQPESFRIEIPDDARVVSALDHPPARAQIDRVFSEAEAKGWVRDAQSEPRDGEPTEESTERDR